MSVMSVAVDISIQGFELSIMTVISAADDIIIRGVIRTLNYDSDAGCRRHFHP
jgi:hypothetical protein